MGKLGAHRALGAIVLASITVTWSRFHSDTYPYSVSQPSSFRHSVLPNTAGQQVDYFFPSLGSFTTNVNIVAMPEHGFWNEMATLRSEGGRNVHRSRWMTLVGRKLPLIHADFNALVGKYSVEVVCFADGNRTWQLTASYEPRYRSLLPTMLRMMGTFRLDGKT